MKNTRSPLGVINDRKDTELTERAAQLQSIEKLLTKKAFSAFLFDAAPVLLFSLTLCGSFWILFAVTDLVSSGRADTTLVRLLLLIVSGNIAFHSMRLFECKWPHQDTFLKSLFSLLEKYSPLDRDAYSLLQNSTSTATALPENSVKAWLLDERRAVQRALGSPLLGPEGIRFINGAGDEGISFDSTTSVTPDLAKNSAALKRIERLAKKYANHPLPPTALLLLLLLGTLAVALTVLNLTPVDFWTAVQSLSFVINTIVSSLLVLVLVGVSAVLLRTLLKFMPAYQKYQNAIFAELTSYQPVDPQAYVWLRRETEKAADFDYDGLQKWLEAEHVAIQQVLGRHVLAPEGTRIIANKQIG